MIPNDQSQTANAIDIPAALYLNQRLVFDMLASLEDGFSQLQNIETSTKTSNTNDQQINGSLGMSNVFALLGVSIAGKAANSATQGDSEVLSEQRVHTPTSLFVRLRQHLQDSGLLKALNDNDSINEISTGDFVEFKVSLNRSPFVEALKGIQEIFKLAVIFSEPGTTTNQKLSKGSSPKNQRPTQLSQQIEKQIDAMVKAVTAAGSVDLIGIWSHGVKFVLTAESDYFIDPTLNDVVDGEFWVLGKVTRIVNDSSDPGISLLRKTPLGILGTKMLTDLGGSVQSVEQSGMNIPTIVTHIPAPAVQVIPVAIFA